MHTLIKNTKINFEKGIPFLLALIAIFITPWDLQEPHAAATLKIAASIIIITILCALLRIKSKTFLGILLLLGSIEICQYNYVLNSRLILKNNTAKELTTARTIKYTNTRVAPFTDSYFDDQLALYAITGDYLQQDFGPSLRQDIVSKSVQQLMLARTNISNPKNLPEFDLGGNKYLFFNTFGNPKYDAILKQELGFNTSKIRLVNKVSLATNDSAAQTMVASQDIHASPVITMIDPFQKPAIFESVPIYTISNTYFSANKHTFLVNNFNRTNMWLIYADANNPNWHANLDGRPTQIYPANLAFKAVQVSPGSHLVEFVYKKPLAIYKIFFVMQIIVGFVLLCLLISFPLFAKYLNNRELNQ